MNSSSFSHEKNVEHCLTDCPFDFDTVYRCLAETKQTAGVKQNGAASVFSESGQEPEQAKVRSKWPHASRQPCCFSAKRVGGLGVGQGGTSGA